MLRTGPWRSVTEAKFAIPDADDGNECAGELGREHNEGFVVYGLDNPGDFCPGKGDLCYCTDVAPISSQPTMK